MTMRRTLETARFAAPGEFPDTQIRCYPITPCEFGTDLSEGCSSYAVRLSAAHKLLPSHFLKSVRLAPDNQHSSVAYNRARLATVNGMGPTAQQITARLSGLTGIENLHYLTALPWAGMLDPKGNHLLKKSRAWCPLCYKEAKDAGTPFFDPLYTSFRVAVVCVKHFTPLQDSCPKCKAAQPFVPRLPFLQHCNKCGHFLGEPQDYGALERLSRRRADVWLTIASADLIRGAIHYQEAVTLEMFTGKLERIMQTHADGKFGLLARQLGLPIDHIRNWLKKGFKPGLPLFLDLCRRLNCPPSSFLFESDELTHPDLWVREKPKVYANRTPRSEREIKLLGTIVRTVLEDESDPPKSIKRVAKELGCSPSYLEKLFPDEVAKIRSRFTTYRTKEVARRKAECEERARRAIEFALSKGISTSERSLKQHKLLTPRDIRRPEFNVIKNEILGLGNVT